MVTRNTLPTNIDATYPDRDKGDQAHQQHHDVIHAALRDDSTPFLSRPGHREGIKATNFSHSYGNIQSPANCSQTYVGRLQNRLGAGAMQNSAGNGYTCQDIAAMAYNGAGGTVAWTPGTPGLVVVFPTQNDMRTNPQSTPAQNGFKHSLAALLWLLRSSVKTEDNAAAWTYSGATSTLTQPWFSGGTMTQMSVQGETATVSGLTVGGNYIVLSRAVSAAAGVLSVACNGVTLGTVDNSAGGQCVADVDSTLAATSAPWAVPVINAGASSIVCTKTDAGTLGTYVDGLLTLSAAPPLVVIVKQPYLSSGVYSRFGAPFTTSGDSIVDTWNGLIDTVVNGIFSALGTANDGSIVVVDLNAAGWDSSTMLSSVTSVSGHPNDRGMAFITDQIISVLPTDYRVGFNLL